LLVPADGRWRKGPSKTTLKNTRSIFLYIPFPGVDEADMMNKINKKHTVFYINGESIQYGLFVWKNKIQNSEHTIILKQYAPANIAT
jgi:hypothetical protein